MKKGKRRINVEKKAVNVIIYSDRTLFTSLIQEAEQ